LAVAPLTVASTTPGGTLLYDSIKGGALMGSDAGKQQDPVSPSRLPLRYLHEVAPLVERAVHPV
jgi:hypothetical protein